MIRKIGLNGFKAHVMASCSVVALAALPHVAMAGCAANVSSYGFTAYDCAGAEPNGLTVSGGPASINVEAAAVVTPPNAQSNAVTLTSSPPSSSYYYASITLSTAGTINGQGQDGVLATSAANATYYEIPQVQISVSQGGVVEGSHGIDVAGDPSTSAPSVSILNAGLITGTGGPALYAANPAHGNFGTVTNQAGGEIDGIYGQIQTLTNAGLIYGGSGSAVASLSNQYWSDQITNQAGGVISSTGSAATLALAGYSSTVSNSGVITNSGGGAAISAANGLNVTNVGGVINGNIVASETNGQNSSTIDNTGGVINGSITLGSGTNRVIADFGTLADPIKNISGTINAGGGTNTLQLNIGSNLSLDAPIAAPATFQKVSYNMGSGDTLTLTQNANPTSTVYVMGSGALINNANITTTGPAIAADGINVYTYGLSVTNNGVINATLSNGASAISTSVYGLGAIVNTGSIIANGGNGVETWGGYPVTNSGSIVADGMAIYAFDSAVTNSGSLRSNTGVALYAFGDEGTPATNSGTIYGQTIGAQLDGYTLTNSGTITSPGVGVEVDPYSSLINQASGVINGGVGAGLYGSTFNVRIVNYGIINGGVDLGDLTSYYGSNNTFVAEPGSVVNGNLVLGGGNDTFVTSLVNTGSGQFAGVTGMVIGGGSDTIRYLVTSDATATISAPSLFGSASYDLSGGAKLTLSGNNLTVSSIGFSGTGSVDLTANIQGSGQTILDLTQTSMQTGGSPAATVPTALDVTSYGVLTQSTNNAYGGEAPAVRLYVGSSFTNAGTISVQSASAPSAWSSPVAAIYGSGSVTNSGTINLSYGVGVQGDGNPLSVVNSGTITQTGGSAASQGVIGATSVNNSGTISVAGSAVVLGSAYPSNAPSTLTNSGTITSSGYIAVTGAIGATTDITNKSGGQISGANLGVDIESGEVVNSGSITGQTQAGVVIYEHGSVTNTSGGVIEGHASTNSENASRYGLGAAAGVRFGKVEDQSTAIATGGGGWYGSGAAIQLMSGTVENQSGGLIAGDIVGVVMGGSLACAGDCSGGSTIVNAGTISGGSASVLFIYSGPSNLTLETGSRLIGDAIVEQPNGASVVNLQGWGTADNRFIGFDGLNVQATGVWALNGASTITTTTVGSGTLQIGDVAHPGAQLTSNVTIQAGATLSGHGTIVGDVTNNGGTVAPGGTIGTLTINGNYTQAANGVLALEVSPGGASSLHVTGTATLAGTLELVADPGVYRKGQSFSVLTAGTTVGGFSTVTASNGLAVSLDGATATFQSGDFPLVAATANQSAIAAGVAAYPVGVSDFDPVANAVIGLPGGARQNAAVDQLGGEIDADLLAAGRESALAVFDGVGEQLSEASLTAGKGGGAAVGWGRVLGRYGTVQSDGNAHGLSQVAGGVVAGDQIERGADTTLGVAFNYQHTDLSLRDLGQSGQFDTVGLAAYGEHRWCELFLDGAASLAWDHGDGVRHIAFSSILRRAEGQGDGYAAGAWASLGVRVVNAYGLRLEPSFSLSYSHIGQSGFTEGGAGGADLAVGRAALDAVQAEIGTRIFKTLDQGRLTLEARLAGTDALRDVAPQAHERFAAAPGTDFQLAGVEPGGAAGRAGAGFTYAASSRLTVFGHYDGTFGPRLTDQVFSLGGSLRW